LIDFNRHNFTKISDAKSLIEAGGKIVFEVVTLEDNAAWVLRIDLPDGTQARHVTKSGTELRTFAKPTTLYSEAMILTQNEIEVELSNDQLKPIYEYQQNRRDRVLTAMKAEKIKISEFCKSNGTTLENLHSVLQGHRRNSELETKIAEVLSEPVSELFPTSIAEKLGINFP